MGDGGSLFLGSFLGSAALLAAPELKAGIVPVAAIPLFILLIPIFDTAFVSVTRRLAGSSPMHGGRDHLSHRLVALGIDERRAVVALYLLAALGGLIALALQHADVGYAALLIALYIILLAGIGVVLGHVEAHAMAPIRMRRSRSSRRSRIRTASTRCCSISRCIALAYYAAFRFRFHGAEFTHFLTYFAASFPLVLACQLAGLAMAGKYRQIWRSFGAPELVGIIKGVASGFGLSAVLILYLYSFQGFSRAVFAIDAVVLVFLLVGSRVAITSADEYLRRQRGAGRPILIYGAGVAARSWCACCSRIACTPCCRSVSSTTTRRTAAASGRRAGRRRFRRRDRPPVEGTDRRGHRQHEIARPRPAGGTGGDVPRPRRGHSRRCASRSRRSDRSPPFVMHRVAEPGCPTT